MHVCKYEATAATSQLFPKIASELPTSWKLEVGRRNLIVDSPRVDNPMQTVIVDSPIVDKPIQSITP